MHVHERKKESSLKTRVRIISPVNLINEGKR